ncbi:MAG TPA: AlpA family transcriptional regulator [Rudaea sp.]|jgi:prophage regulatory protein|nr:AlpA family transcriptional regulator [Rudaea sp.]
MNSQNEIQTFPPVRMLRLPEVIRKTALSRSQIYRLIDFGEFPKQVPLCERAVGWIEEEIDLWLQGRIEHSRNLQG